MLRHIVFWKLKAENKSDNLSRMEGMLLSLKDKVPQVRDLETGRNVKEGAASWDIALSVSLDDEAALDAYQEHPEHLKVRDFIVSVTTDRAVVDYNL